MIFLLRSSVVCLTFSWNYIEAAIDEGYARISLFPESQNFEQKLQEGEIEADNVGDNFEAAMKLTTPHMCCKTLTALVTKTHGGFSSLVEPLKIAFLHWIIISSNICKSFRQRTFTGSNGGFDGSTEEMQYFSLDVRSR